MQKYVAAMIALFVYLLFSGATQAQSFGTIIGDYRLGKYKINFVLENVLNTEWNEAQFDTASRLHDEAEPVSELHFTPGNPRNVRVGLSYLF